MRTAGQAGRLRGLGDLNPENFYLRSRGAASTPPSLTQPQGAWEGLQPFMTHKRLFQIILKTERGLGGGVGDGGLSFATNITAVESSQ